MTNEPWPPRTITLLRQSLETAKLLITESPRDQPDEVGRSLVRYFVVRTCGYLEQVVHECCTAHMRGKSDPRTAKFASSWLGRGGSNPTPEKLVTLVNRFDVNWGTELADFFNQDDELLKREISLLVDRRNAIAHGKSESLGARKALDLVDATQLVANWFIDRFKL